MIELIEKPFLPYNPSKKWVLTIGNFDGFHLGHQELVKRVIKEKKAKETLAGILTFTPHPKQFLNPMTPLPMIYDEDEKWNLLKKSGLDAGFNINFNKKFASLSPKDFLVDFLFKRFNLKKLILGYDFNFGKQRSGSSDLIAQLAHDHNIGYEKLQAVKQGATTASSTMIRRLLFEGEFKQAEEFLTRAWQISGTVVKGKQLGRTIGFPTMNILPKITLPIQNGVYICDVILQGEKYQAVSNVGIAPTVDSGRVQKIESYLFNFNQECYGEHIRVIPRKFIRTELTFPSLDELVKQIHCDVKTTQDFFKQVRAD